MTAPVVGTPITLPSPSDGKPSGNISASLDSAIYEEDSQKCVRLAHYSKGACANLGANAAAAVLKQIERKAAGREFLACRASLANLAAEIERLRSEAFAI